MKTITLTLTIPDGVEVKVEQTTTPKPVSPTNGDHWPEGECPKHGPDAWKDSRFGGMYCTAKDPSTQKGYCVIKSGMTYNGRLVLE